MRAKTRVRARAIMEYLTQCHPLTPTYRQIAAHIGVTSVSTVEYYLDLLEGMGYIGRSPGRNCGIRLLVRFGEGRLVKRAAAAPPDEPLPLSA